MSAWQPWAEALAAVGPWIIAVGSNSEIESMIQSDWKVLDLGGKLAVPGLIDSHVHFLSFALGLRTLDLGGAPSVEAVLNGVRQQVERTQPGEWIVGRGWDKNLWPDSRRQSKADLDAFSPANPVALYSKDGHTLWVNSLALRIAKVNEHATKLGSQVEGSPITGELSGILRETAVDLVDKAIVLPGPAERERALVEAIGLAQQHGLTGIHDMEGQAAFKVFQTLAQKGELKLRVLMNLPKDNLEAAIRLGLRSGFGNEFLRIGGVKLFADGTLGSQSAALLDHYEGQASNTGILVTGREELTDLAGRASKAGLNVAIHAIGDAAVRVSLDALAVARASDPALRHRLEHIQLIHPTDLPRFAELGVVASMQPVHATADRDLAERFWGSRCQWSYPYHSLRQSGAVICCGSDTPVETIDPLRGIYAAVTRRREDEPEGQPWHPEQRLTLLEALRGYTLGAAYASGEEGIKGALEPGKLADVVVLSQDVFALPPDQIIETIVEQTILGGEVVYCR